METLQISDLSLDELERVQKTLVRRYGIGRRGNVLQLGFGVAEFESRGELDWDRPDAICFYVSRKTKSQPRERRDRIPTEIRVRVRRGATFCQLVAPTDVISVNPVRCTLSGRKIQYGGLANATTGVLLAWKPDGHPDWTWGVLTVGHTFPKHLPLPDQQMQVQIAGTPPIPGRFFARAANDRMDISLSVVQKDDLIKSDVISAGPQPIGLVIRTTDEIRHDIGAHGTTQPHAAELPFRVLRFLVSAPMFRSQLGFSPQHVVHVGRAANGSFRLGTSGSAWRINRQPACIQFGTYRPRFNEGFGHSLETVVGWVRDLTGVDEVRVVQVF